MKNQVKRIMVNMSATLIHHGHIRILRTAKELGEVIVALTTDEEIVANKGYQPELNFEERREILEAIKYVDGVVPSPWSIDESFLDMHNINLLVHGDDDSIPIDVARILIVPRTEGISSTLLRRRILKTIADHPATKDEQQ